MKFDKLNDLIPKVPADKDRLHEETMYIGGGYGWSVRVKWPGKHKESSGDFVVETLSEATWDDYHQFTHHDLFKDVEAKYQADPDYVLNWLIHVLGVVKGTSAPRQLSVGPSYLPGIHIDALTHSIQALTVCEYRRFPQGDVRGGGRYLPINFMLAILGGFLTMEEAEKGMRRGWPTLRDLPGFVPFNQGQDPMHFDLYLVNDFA